MAVSTELSTDRLRLRRWIPSDLEPFAGMNADPLVMEHFPSVLSRDESEAIVARIEAEFDQKGFGLWAVEIPGIAPFIGFVGLAVPGFQEHFTPCVEICWRIPAAYWNRGYASEAARVILTFGFKTLKLNEIVSFTATQNLPSRRVMEKIGMVHDPAEDFEHPSLPMGHHLRRHVLYRIQSPGEQTKPIR